MTSYNLNISGLKSGVTPTNVNVWCSDWTIRNWEHEIVVLADSVTKRNAIRNYLTPGAVDLMYDILGKPTYYDTTLTNSNTILVTPKGKLASYRTSVYIAISNYEETIVATYPNVMYKIVLRGYEVSPL